MKTSFWVLIMAMIGFFAFLIINGGIWVKIVSVALLTGMALLVNIIIVQNNKIREVKRRFPRQ